MIQYPTHHRGVQRLSSPSSQLQVDSLRESGLFVPGASSLETSLAESTSADPSSDGVQEMYFFLMSMTQVEGGELWNRFNIIVSVNLVLLGAVAFVLSSDITNLTPLLLILSLAGAAICIWSLYVLRRLWLWHSHWKACSAELEVMLPEGLPRPITKRPTSIQKNSSWYRAWILDYTQPFMVILATLWIAIVVLLLVGVDLTPARDVVSPPQVPTSQPVATPPSTAVPVSTTAVGP